jgi:hypothetical protein
MLQLTRTLAEYLKYQTLPPIADGVLRGEMERALGMIESTFTDTSHLECTSS